MYEGGRVNIFYYQFIKINWITSARGVSIKLDNDFVKFETAVAVIQFILIKW